jgi:hypothetical protein
MATANLNQPTSALDGNIPYTGETENDGKGNTLREAINRINARIKELYGSQDASNVVQTPFVDADNIKYGGVGTLQLANDAVDYDKLAGEFTTSSPLTAATDLDIDFSTAAVFTTTSAIAMDLNFTNAEVGQVKTIIVTDSGGTSSLTFDTGTNTVVNLNGTYSATAGAVNYIQAQCIAANSFILTISQAAA